MIRSNPVTMVCRYTGTERERPTRILDLASYRDPVTFIGSDGSETGQTLQRAFQSIIKDGETKLSRNINEDIISNSTGKYLATFDQHST